MERDPVVPVSPTTPSGSIYHARPGVDPLSFHSEDCVSDGEIARWEDDGGLVSTDEGAERL